MSKKKDFDSAAFNAVTGGSKKEKEQKRRVGRPKDPNKRTPTKTSQEGTKNTETRATFIVNEEKLEKLKTIAKVERILIKTIVDQSFDLLINAYEKKYGEIEPKQKEERLKL
jgi:hypothetical protein